MEFYIVDVFATEKYSGNQLAVCIPHIKISDEKMQKIAKEFNFPETTFITQMNMKKGEFSVRIFTPNQEVPFAGHPTLGTAHIIFQFFFKTQKTLVLKEKVGDIIVEKQGENEYWMKQQSPKYGEIIPPKKIAEILSIPIEFISKKYPVEEVSTGLPFIIVPLQNLENLKQITIHKEKYFSFIKNRWAQAIYTFSEEPYNKNNTISTRMFADIFGIPEDPATGSGNGCLLAYLLKHTFEDSGEISLWCEQGYEIGRPSLLLSKGKKVEDIYSINVGGNVITIAHGDLY